MLKHLILLALFVNLINAHRKISHELNPNCPIDVEKHLNGPIIHVTADGDNDTLHHVWDLTYKPCLFIALTPKDTNLSINWNEFIWNGADGSVKFTQEPIYIFSVVFNELIEFNDENNTGKFNPLNNSTNYRISVPLNLTWEVIQTLEKVDNGIVYQLYGKGGQLDGKIKLSLTAYGNKGHGGIEPHLLHTSNATQVDFVFDDLKTHFSSPRIAIKFIVVSTNEDRSFYQTEKTSLHDEHSPGIFTVSEVSTAMDEENKEKQGYMQWRNVAYTSSDRSMTNSTDVSEYTAHIERDANASLYGTFTRAFFGPKLYILPVHFMHVSFGTQDDGYYSKTQYLSWTLTAGIGKPAEESFSMLVILVLTIGLLGIPVVFITFGVLYLISRRISNTRDDMLTQ